MSEHRLNEIVIERPRGGSRLSLKKKGLKKDLEKLTTEAITEGLLSPYLIKPLRKTKYLSDHIAPLRRLLHSKVGMEWNDVYKELCHRLDITTLSGQHILSHVWHFVERYIQIVDGVPYVKPNNHCYHFYQIQVGKLYVHPDSGILCIHKKINTNQPQTPKKITVLDVDDYHQYQKLDGIWYGITFQVASTEINSENLIDRNGKSVCISKKKQCNKKELKFINEQI